MRPFPWKIVRSPLSPPVMSPVGRGIGAQDGGGGGGGGGAGLAIPAALRSLLFHDDGTATKYPAYYTEDEWAGHSHLLKDYSLGVGELREKRLGYCYDFDGVDDEIVVGNLAASLYSVKLRFYTDTVINSASAKRGLFSYSFSSVANNGLILGSWTSFITDEVITFSDGSNRRTAVVNITIPIGWHEIEVVWDAGVNRYDIVLDGVVQSVTSGATSHVPSVTLADVRIGRDQTVFAPYRLADVIIKTSDETIIAHYPLQEESGATAYDISGNGNHGTILNAVTSGVGSIHQPDAGVVKSYANDEGYSRRMLFDGVDDQVGASIPSPFNIQSGQFRVSLKCYLSDVTTLQSLFGIGQGVSGSINLVVSGGAVRLGERQAGGFTGTPNSLPVTAGNLYDVTLTYGGNSSTSILEVNGATDSRSVYVNDTHTVSLVQIGANGYGSGEFRLASGNLVWDIKFDPGNTGTWQHIWKGYGNTNDDWLDQIGSSHGTVNGSPGLLTIPATSLSQDALGGTLTYTGRCPNYGLAKGPAWQGDGSAVYVDLGSPVIPASSDFTITIPYKHVGVSTQAVFSQTETAVTAGRMLVYANQPTANRLRFVYIDLGNTITIDLPVCLTVNEFHLITASRTGNALRITCEGSLGTFTDTESPTTLSVAQFNTHLLSYASSSRSAGAAGPFAITVGGLTTTYSPIEGTRNVAVTRSDGTYAVIANAVKNGALATIYSDGDGSWQLAEIANGAQFDGVGLFPAAPGASVAASGNALNIPANKHPIGILVDRTGGVVAPFDYLASSSEYTSEAFNDIPTDNTLNKRGLSIYAADRYGAALEDIQS